jgi:uncharacterized protein YbjT (DUF2867 family)
MRIVIIGATGLVGSSLCDRLLERRGIELHALLRRPSGRAGAAYREHVAQPADWPSLVSGLAPDKAVSALGTTMRAAGSDAAFRAVDLGLVVAFAAAARAAGARQMLTVSSVGADAESRNVYLRTKGEMEQSLADLGFERLDILRPGLLRGERGGERRVGERLGILISPVANLFLRGPLDRYAAIDAAIVSRAAAACLDASTAGLQIHDNGSLRQLAERGGGT